MKRQGILSLTPILSLVCAANLWALQEMDHDKAVATFKSIPGNATLSVLWRSSRHDLEVVDEQVSALDEIKLNLFRELNEMVGDFNRKNAHLSDEELENARGDFRLLVQAKTALYEEQAKNVLMPHQRERLAQIVVQRAIERFGPSTVLLHGKENNSIAELLGLTDEQKEKLKKKSEQAKKKLLEKIARAQREAIEDVLGVLTPTQRKKYDGLVGDPLDKSAAAAGAKVNSSAARKE